VWACQFCQTPFLFRARFRHRSLESIRRWARFLAGIDTRDLRVLTPSALSWGSPEGGCELAAIEALLATAREAIGPNRRLFVGSFPSELRPEHVSPEALALLRRYCDNRTVIIGGQSGSERLLAAMKRGHDAESVARAARLALEAGFTPSVDFIFGLPGEVEDDRIATRALARRSRGGRADSRPRLHAAARHALVCRGSRPDRRRDARAARPARGLRSGARSMAPAGGEGGPGVAQGCVASGALTDHDPSGRAHN
jgi:radical SAM superfamily enzyme YgiQ (UPF0313 family)